jgi:TetR/AcrR family transcriptional regulator, transcriptional repressor for nem operon
MPYAPEHSTETRNRILDSARRLFNRNGLTDISIDKIMAGAGLTHGGFYKYFASKEDLYAEAITHFVNCGPSEDWQRPALTELKAGMPPDGKRLSRAILNAYLSRDHLDDIEGSCPVIGLATDVSRCGSATKRAYRQVMEMMVGIFGGNLGPNPIAREAAKARNEIDSERALAVVAMCVGGMVLARAVDDEDRADELRNASHKYAMALAGWEAASA